MKKNLIRKKNGLLQMAAALGLAICMSGCGASGGADPAEAENVEILAGTGQQDAGSEASGEPSAEAGQAAQPAPGESGSGQEESTAAGYCFIVNGVTVSVDADMDELAEQLGESKSIFTAPSCAGEGITYVYDFVSYEIETYPAEDGKNRIGYIIFKDDMVATEEGIDLSMTREDVIRVYGGDGEETENRITYEKDGMKLNFLFEGENMISIEYASAVIA
ncbi:MAG: hypothetical protein NC121_12995 [Blautia sp.]|nr:hypothetical protein [Blautia sp.]